MKHALAFVTLTLVAQHALADAPAQHKTSEFDYAHADAAKVRARRVELAKQAYDMAVSRMMAGAGTFDAVLAWSERLRESEAAALDARTAAAHDLERAKVIEPVARDRVNAGVASADTLLAAQWWRASAELAVKEASR